MKCPQCPYYEQKTSYGTELIKCNNEDCPYKAKSEPQETETWHGYHIQITAPKGTFKKIWEEAEKGEE